MDRKTYFVDVLLPLHLPDTYTYRVPFDYNDDIAVGQRVAVQFGQKRRYSALVRRVHEQVPAYKTKYILSILDNGPIVSERQFLFWEWMAKYYMCYIGDVMAVAFPTASKLSSESFITIHPDFAGEYSQLNENEIKIVDILSHQNVLAINEVSSVIGFQKIMPLIKTMIEKHIIVMEEELKQRFVPKVVANLTLNPIYLEETAMHDIFNELEKKSTTHKQLSVLMKFMQLTKFGKESIKKKTLTDCKELSASAIASLIKREIILQEDSIENRIREYDVETDVDTIQLNEQQQVAYTQLSDCSQPQVMLLHGVTYSGKTEVDIKLINDVLRQGKQVLFLLPEIALTAQIINRLRKYFGKHVGVYHSRFNANERAEVWHRTMTAGDDGYTVLLGARSAVFLPFRDLGLVIVDEEHDSSYKQYDPAPRYNARDTAIVLAQIYGAKTILGSATPSLESYFNAKEGKYELLELKKRYSGTLLPEILVADVKEALKYKEMHSHFSKLLIDNITEALKNKEQVILFQNRRGFARYLQCEACGYVKSCKFCDVSLTYHKHTESLKCHYCGYTTTIDEQCSECGSHKIKMIGFGTEKIEDR